MRTKCLRLDNSLPSEPEPLGGWIHPEPSKGGNGVRAIALVTVGALVLVLAAAFGPAAIAGDKPKTDDERSGISRADLVGVNFIESCRFSHQAPDDPIVFPGKPGASHQHTFVGNRTTSAFSNFGSLRSGGTTCMRADDTAAYWVPTLLRDGRALEP